MACGGVPPEQCRREGTPSLGEAPDAGAGALCLLWGFSKVSRCKSETLSSRDRSNGYVHRTVCSQVKSIDRFGEDCVLVRSLAALDSGYRFRMMRGSDQQTAHSTATLYSSTTLTPLNLGPIARTLFAAMRMSIESNAASPSTKAFRTKPRESGRSVQRPLPT